jgi:PAS domain S-box-containing protein
MGDTGETYAFDKRGNLITESRFDDHLRAAGLIAQDQRGILSIEIRDPGINLMENAKSTISQGKRPLTLAAKRAISGKSGVSIKGYRDYRGVNVVGAWMWDDELEFGMTTEIDYDEAFQPYRYIRNTLIFVISIALILFTGLSLNLINSRKRMLLLREEAEKLANDTVEMNRVLELEISEREIAEEELWKSRQSLEKAQEIAHLGNWEWDIKTGALAWSDEIYRIFGLKPKEFEASYDSFLNYIHPDDVEAVVRAVNEAVDGKKTYSIEHRVVRHNGSERFVHEQGEVTLNEYGKAFKMVGIVHDITEHKQAELALEKARRETEQALIFNQTILDESPVGISIYDESGQCISANETIGPMIGATREQVLAQDYNFIESWKKSGLYDAAKKALQNDISERLSLSLITTFGKGVSLDCHLVPFVSGGSKYLMFMADDISERVNAENERRKAEEQVHMLLDSTAEAIYGLDLEGNCTFANPACLRMIGYNDMSDIIGKNMHELIHHTRPDGTDYPEKECKIYEAFQDGQGAHVKSWAR